MAEPANRQTNKAGGKFYLHPVTGEQFTSVTTALDVIGKSALKIWAGMVAADMAFDLIPQMTTSVLEPLCGNTFNRCYQKHGPSARCERCPCGVCEKCIWRRIAWRHAAESARRADEGHQLHEAVRFWASSGGKEVSLPREIFPYWQAFLAFVADYGLMPEDWRATEITMINREHMYAGTSDAVVLIRRERSAKAAEACDLFGPNCNEVLVRIDYKTREKADERTYDDMPLQGVAYDRCTVGMLDNGDEYEIPRTDLVAILQLRPFYLGGVASDGGDYSFKPMVADDETFRAFLQALGIYRWIEGAGKKAFDLAAVQESVRAREAANTAIATALIKDVFGGQPIDEDGHTVIELPEEPRNWADAAPAETDVIEPITVPAFDDPWGETKSDEQLYRAVPPPDDDPWGETAFVPVAAETAAAPVPGSLADLKAHGDSNPPKKAAKKAAPRKSAAAKKAAISATQAADPFELAKSPTMASLKDFDPGKPDMSALGDDIPF